MYRFGMKRHASTGLKLLAAFIAALLLVYLGLFSLLHSTVFRVWAQAELSRSSGMEVRFADLSLQLPFQIAADNLEVSRPGMLLFRAARLRVTFTPLDLWLKTVHRVSVEQPELTVDVTEIMKPSGADSPTVGIRHLNVDNGALILTRRGATVFELPNVNLDARNLNLGQESGIRLRAEVPWLQGEAELQLAGALRALTGEMVIRPKTGRKNLPGSTANQDRAELLRLRAKFNAPEEQQAHATVEAKLENFPAGAGRLSGNLDAQANVDSDWKELRFAGNAALESVGAALGATSQELSGSAAAMDFSGAFFLSDKTLKIKSTSISSPFGKVSGSAALSLADRTRVDDSKFLWKELPLMALRSLLPSPYNLWMIDGRAQVDLEARGPIDTLQFSGNARGEGAKIQSDAMNLTSVNFVLPFEWSDGKARVREAKITATQVAYNGQNRWKASAERAQLSGSAEYSGSDSMKLAVTIDAGGGKFTSPDGSRIGENVTLRGPLELVWLSGKKSTRIAGDLTANSGEILWDKFFTDLKTEKPRIVVDSEYLRDEDRLECRPCSADLAGVGAVHAAGAIALLTQAPQLRLEVRSTNFSPGTFFEAFVRENLNRQYPALDALLLRGAMAFQARLQGTPESLQLDGDVSLNGGELRGKTNDWEISGIGLKLPFAIGWSDGFRASGEARPGRLSIEKIRFAGRDVRFSPAAVSLHENELRFHEPLRLAAFGGEISIGDLRWADVIRQPKQLTFSFDTKQLQLQELTETFDWPRFSGTLTGSIPQVQSTGAILKTNGEIRAEVFGGRVRVSKLEIDDPFSALAAIRLDAALANIDLEQLSKTFAFGRISGILEGTVADLIITDGQPAQFGADLHSVDRGGEQRISVEALNKITVLSSGQSAGALYGGLAGLFDSFRYSKLGFKAILRNDRLVLRGVETRGDQEYLVVGSLLPPTVNIVSHTQTIGFSELLRRLERIQTDSPKVQ
jgi:hypothetical protein